MYHKFYNLTTEPFRLSPDHRFCYKHRSYGRAKTYMTYALDREEGFVVVTGSPGTGKSTLIEDLFADLKAKPVVKAKLVSTQLEADDLVRMVVFSFGVQAAGLDKATLIVQLTDVLVKHRRSGRRALLVVDEAQDLSHSALEELRLLTNLQKDSVPLLQIFLVGQQELRDLIRDKSMEQLHQRIIAACHLEPLKAEETRAYVEHRLIYVGWNGDPCISDAAFHMIHEFSAGVPRRINLVCSRLFLHGCVEERHKLLVADVQEVLQELVDENLDPLDDIPREINDLVADIPAGLRDECTPSKRVANAAKKPQPEALPQPKIVPAGNVRALRTAPARSDNAPVANVNLPGNNARAENSPATKVVPRDDVLGKVSTQQGDLGKPGKKGGADIAPVKKTVAGDRTKKRQNTPVERAGAGQRNSPPSFKQANALDDPSQLTRRPKPRRRWIYWTAIFIFIAALIAFVVYGLNIYYGWNIDPFASIRTNLEAGFTQDAEIHDASPSFTENQVNPPADADNGNEVIAPQEDPRKDEQAEVQRIEGAKNLPASRPRTENSDRSRYTDGAIIFDAAPPKSYDEREQTEIVAHAQPQRLDAVESNPADPVQIEPDIAAEIGAVEPGPDPAVKLPSSAAIKDTVEQMTSRGSPERTVVSEETSDHGALVAADSNHPYQNSGFVAGNMRSDEFRPTGVVAPAQAASTPTAGTDPVWDPIGSLEQALRQLPFHIKRLDDGTLEVDMGDTVSFDFGSAELDPSSVGTLDKLAAALKPHTDISLRVVGHTDSTGPESFNLVLSKRRAVAVGNYLIIKRGGADNWVQAEGRGESEPVAPGNRARNRRIVLYIAPVHQG